MLNWTDESIRVSPAWLNRFTSLGTGGGRRLTFVVSASVRFSGASGDSRFKSIELSAEATVDGKEPWMAQAKLYHQLGCQLMTLWANGTGHKALGRQSISARDIRRSLSYSHKSRDGKWCREK